VVAVQVNVPDIFWSRVQFDAIPAPEKIFTHAPAAVVAPVPPQGMPVGLPQEDGSALFELLPENGP
jgi:hypothetical protein